jgi:hypothetical protein
VVVVLFGVPARPLVLVDQGLWLLSTRLPPQQKRQSFIRQVLGKLQSVFRQLII